MTINKRRATNQQATFDYTTPNLEITAQPTTQASFKGIPSVVTPEVDNSGSMLANFLNLGMSALELYEKKIDIPNQEEQGQIEALEGKEAPSQGYYRIKTYYNTKGQLDAQSAYKNEVAQFTEKYRSVLGAKEFQEGLNQISQKYLEGATPDYAKGFLPTAKSVEEQAIGAWTDTQISLEKSRNTSLMMESIKALDTSTLENPESYITSLKDFQKKGEALGVDKKTVSAMFLSQIAQTAIEQGKPELLDFTKIKDKDGISLETVFGDAIKQYKEQAIQTQYNLELAKQKQEETLSKQAVETFKKNMYINISDLGLESDPSKVVAEAGKLKAALLSSKEVSGLSASELKSMLGDIDDLIKTQMSDTAKPNKSNTETIVNLTEQALNETLDSKEIIGAFTQGLITQTDFNKYINEYKKQEEEKLREEQLKKQQESEEPVIPKIDSQTKQEITTMVSLTAQNLAGTDSATGMFLQNTLATHKQALMTRAYDYINNNPEGSLEDFTEKVLKPYVLSHGHSYDSIISGQVEDDVTTNEDLFNLIKTPVQPEVIQEKGLFRKEVLQELPEPTEVANVLKGAKNPRDLEQRMSVVKTKYNLDDSQVKHYYMQYGLANLISYNRQDPYQQMLFLQSLGLPEDLYDEVMSAYTYYSANPYK